MDDGWLVVRRLVREAACQSCREWHAEHANSYREKAMCASGGQGRIRRQASYVALLSPRLGPGSGESGTNDSWPRSRYVATWEDGSAMPLCIDKQQGDGNHRNPTGQLGRADLVNGFQMK